MRASISLVLTFGLLGLVASTVFVLRRSLESLGPSFESFVVPFFPGLGYVANGISAVLFSILRFLSFVPSRRSATVCAS